MEQTKDIVAQIRENYDAFSKSHRRLADFILDNPEEVAFLSIKEFSQRTGISAATITRFVRRLEYQGYGEFQRGMYENQKQRTPFGKLKSLLRSQPSGGEEGEDPLGYSIQSNIRLLEELDTPQLRQAFARARDILSQSRTIYIAGQRSSYATAYYLAFMLQQMCGNISLLPTSASKMPGALCDVGPEDCLVVVSYARYTSATYDLVNYFHDQGCQIVALTDSMASPIALKSSQVLIAPNGENFSPVAAITLCNCLITSLGRLDAQRTLERMELQDKIALQYHVYL